MSDLVERMARPCTCHPSEAPVPCRKQYAFLDCIRAEARAIALEEAARASQPPSHMLGSADPYANGYLSACKDIAAAIWAMIPTGNAPAQNDDADSK
jgi:hypothetical protein